MAYPFQPKLGSTVNVAAVSAVSQRVQVTSEPGNYPQIRAFNATSGTVWVNFGDVGVVATAAAGIPLPAGAIEVLSVPPSVAAAVNAAVIAAAGTTGSVYFTPGAGI